MDAHVHVVCSTAHIPCLCRRQSIHVSTAQDFAAALSGLPRSWRAKHLASLIGSPLPSKLRSPATTARDLAPSAVSHRVGPLKSACSTWMVQGCKMQLPAAARFSTECRRANLRCSLPLQYHITFYPIILSSCRLCTVAWSPSLSARSTVEPADQPKSKKPWRAGRTCQANSRGYLAPYRTKHVHHRWRRLGQVDTSPNPKTRSWPQLAGPGRPSLPL